MEAPQEQSQTTQSLPPSNISELISMIVEAGDEAMKEVATEVQQ